MIPYLFENPDPDPSPIESWCTFSNTVFIYGADVLNDDVVA